MGEMLALGLVGLVCVTGGAIWGLAMGRASGRREEHDRWLAASKSEHRWHNCEDGDFIVMPRGEFWHDWSNPRARCRRDHAAGVATRLQVRA